MEKATFKPKAQLLLFNIGGGKGVKFTLEQATKTQWGSRGIALLFNLCARWGVGDQCHALATLPPGEGPTTHCIGCWMGHRASLEGCRKSRSHRDSIPRL